jgi:chromosome segregation ATPase
MSTAGKVLTSLILVMAIIWIILTASVDQLNRNGNQAIAKLNSQMTDLSEQLVKVKHDISATKDRITVQQEATDREIARLRSSQSDYERARSEMTERLSQVQFELANLLDTVKNAQVADEQRLAEVEDEKKQMGELGNELSSLKQTNSRMIARIADLRQKFQESYRASRDYITKSK